MDLSLTTTIFLFVVCLCGGIVIGAMFGRMKKEQVQEPVSETASEPVEESTGESVEEPAQALEAPPAEPPSLAQDGETEILRAWRDRDDHVWLEMDGQRLERSEDLQSGQRKELVRMVLDLRPWLGAAPPAQKEPPPPHRQPLFARPARAKKEQAPPESEKPPVSLKSIVGQIDDVLQQKLAASSFAHLDIHLLEGRDGEVMVQVGSMRHAGVDAVPHEGIRDIIHAAVEEWEKGSQ